ncbi:MAG: ABC transporter permease [Elusimicrobia bacterium CG08_land_8_20_14_0_20_51_18]|nr:MAG: ABC transporter permease [Elusimicrobia bacterium CG08_land_8_20_14_0_20_51_18]
MKRTLKAFIRKEFAQALRDPRMKLILFVMPMIQMAVFGLALSSEIRNIKLAAVYSPGDVAAAGLTRRFISSGWFVPADPGRARDPSGLIVSGKADAVLVFPVEGFARAAARGRGMVQLLVDATSVTRARSVEAYARNIFAAHAAADAGLEASSPPFGFDVRIIYNPEMESPMFMVPGVMGMIVCLVTIILTSMSLTRERETGTFETIVSAPLENHEILLGKTIPYVVLGLANAALVIAAGFLLFGVPVKGQLWQLFVASLAFVITTVAIGTLISTISKNQQQAMMGGFIFLFPAVLMSGIMYPVENMPVLLKPAVYLNPLYYFTSLLRNIMLKGGDPAAFISNLSALFLMAVSAASLAYARFRQTLD